MTAETPAPLTMEMFSDKVGDSFAIDEPGAPPEIAFELIEVTPLRNFAKLQREPFSLVFKASGIGPLPQRIYGLRHATLGSCAIFLVPIGREGDAVLYQAVFN